MDRRLGTAGLGLVAAILGGCHQATPQEDAQSKIQGCANEAAEFLDADWGPQQVTGTYPDVNGGIEAVIAVQGVKVTVNCAVDSGYYMHVLGPVVLVAGDAPQPGQLYLPRQHRWLTDAELHARMAGLLAPRPGEYAGVAWAPIPSAIADVSELAKAPTTSCFVLQSKLEPARMLVACQVAVGHRFWVSQGPLTFEVTAPPAGLAPIPPAPKLDWLIHPSGAPSEQ